MNDTPKLMTVDEIAAFLRVHRATIYRMLNEGRLPACRIGRRHLFDITKVMERLEKIEQEGGGK